MRATKQETAWVAQLGAPGARFAFRTPGGAPVWTVGGRAYVVPIGQQPVEYTNATMKVNRALVGNKVLVGTARGGKPLWTDGRGRAYVVRDGEILATDAHPNLVAGALRAGDTPWGRPRWTRSNRGYYVVEEGAPMAYRIDAHMKEIREEPSGSDVLPDSRTKPPRADPSGLKTQFGTFKLKAHQVTACKLFVNPKVPGLLLFYKVGSGKTLASIAAVENYKIAVRDPKVRAVVIAPASLKDNYSKELVAAGVDPSGYVLHTYHSFQALKTRDALCTGSIIVVDEAHKLRNGGLMAQSILGACKLARKRLLLTGTPVMNRPDDIAALLKAIHCSTECDTVMKKWPFGKSGLERTDLLVKYLRCATLFYEPDAREQARDYPVKEEHFVNVPMSPGQLAAHRSLMSDDKAKAATEEKLLLGKLDTSFLTKPRQISTAANTADASDHPKIDVAVDKIVDALRRGHKCIVYCTFVANGIDVVERDLVARGVPPEWIAKYTGETKGQRTSFVSRYNEGSVGVLLLSRAGGEGLDLKNTREVHMLEPEWNAETTEQVVGRAVRYKSHESLPPDQRKVDVYHYFSHLPGADTDIGGTAIGKSVSLLEQYSADEVLAMVCRQKLAITTEFVDTVLVPASDDNVKACA